MLGLASRIWEYLLAAGIYWWGALAVLTAIERHSERLFPSFWKKHVDPWLTPMRRKQILVVCALFAFLIGNFRAFDEQNTRLREQRNEINRLNSQLERIHQRSEVKEQLQQFYVDVGPILERHLEKGTSDEEFKKYVSQAQAWVDNTAGWIEENMGIPARERFLDRTGIMASRYSAAINNEHNALISNLTRLRLNLRELIVSPAWDKR